MSSQKLFKRQSGQMQAVREDIQELLQVTREVVTKVRTSSPPPGPLRKPMPPLPRQPIPREEEEEDTPSPEDSEKSG